MPRAWKIATCKDCKWWAEKDGRSPHEHKCQFKYTNDNPPKTDWCFAESWDSSEGVIITGPDFGCIHWEKKDE